MTVVRHQLFSPQKRPVSCLRFSRTWVQPSPGSATIELPSAFAESGAYSPNRALPGSPRQCSLPLTCCHPPEGHQIGARKRRAPGNTILSQPSRRHVLTDRLNREGSQSAACLEGEPGPALHPPERPSHTHAPKPGFGGRGDEASSLLDRKRPDQRSFNESVKRKNENKTKTIKRNDQKV